VEAIPKSTPRAGESEPYVTRLFGNTFERAKLHSRRTTSHGALLARKKMHGLRSLSLAKGFALDIDIPPGYGARRSGARSQDRSRVRVAQLTGFFEGAHQRLVLAVAQVLRQNQIVPARFEGTVRYSGIGLSQPRPACRSPQQCWQEWKRPQDAVGAPVQTSPLRETNRCGDKPLRQTHVPFARL
jgi:hypothetical protein